MKVRRVKGRKRLYFYEGDNLIAAATVRWEDSLGWLEDYGFTKNGKVYRASNPTLFLAAMILYSVLQTKRRRSGIEKLKSTVNSLELIELRLWANYIKEAYRARGIMGIYKPARAFKTLFDT